MIPAFGWLVATPLIAGLFVRRPNPSRAEGHIHALLARMRQRLYPETIPVLGSFWLKTVYASTYGAREWRELIDRVKAAARGPLPDEFSRQTVIDIQEWIDRTQSLPSQAAKSQLPVRGAAQSRWSAERVTAYIVRLLNEWLPLEVARLLAYETETAVPQIPGIPVLAIGAALERLLSRAHFSPEILERMLEPGLLSPEYAYPHDVEMLRDVVLSLLGRTRAPAPPVIPATLLCVGECSHLPANYREEVRNAYTILKPAGDELFVPIEPRQTVEIMKNEPVQIGSIIVTMDGRSWEAETVQSGERDSIVYRPIGRLRIDYSGEHARVRVPWAENRLRWFGKVHSGDRFTLFGREWHVAGWEVNAERTWLDLVFSRILSVSNLFLATDSESWKLRPASVDMAWAALEAAVARSVAENSDDPVEHLHFSELIPLGRAIVRLNELMMSRKSEMYKIEIQLKAIQYMETAVIATYGQVPWRILPRHIRGTFLRVQRFRSLLGTLNTVFEGVPDVLREVSA